LIIGGIVVFFMIRLAIGYYASRKVKTTVDYIVAGRRLPIYLAGASIMATWFAAETLMGASAEAYKYGFQGVVFDPFGAALCLFISGFFFIRLDAPGALPDHHRLLRPPLWRGWALPPPWSRW
jgi:solute:Na+ symporter, SSS family